MKTTKYGAACYPGGRCIEITSPHREWLDWALLVLDEAAAKEAGTTMQAGPMLVMRSAIVNTGRASQRFFSDPGVARRAAAARQRRKSK